MLALDTNILVRLVTGDDPAAADRVQKVLDAELMAGRSCWVGHIVLCELVWVLQRLYGYSLGDCQNAMSALLGFTGLRFEALPVVLLAFKAWQAHGGDWADHLIGAQMQALGCEAVLTLDKAASRAATHRLVKTASNKQ
jgi:predicted nucleic-acid-binding protein